MAGKWLSFAIICIFRTAEATVCLHDKRLAGTSTVIQTRNYLVPGYVYDDTLVGIFMEQKDSRSSVYIPVNGVIATPEDDHDPNNDKSESSDSGATLAMGLISAIIVVIVIVRLFPTFPTPITTLMVGVVAAILYRVTAELPPNGEHVLNMDTEFIVFAFTPVLVLGEILKLDVRLARRLVLQFSFYGLIGGVINTFITTGLLKLIMPDDWQLELLLSLGALMSTADASFVGGILGRAGVPSRIVMLIEGESMSNDPALFALLTLAKEFYVRSHLRTEHVLVSVSTSEAISMAAKIILSGIALGAICGMLALVLVTFTNNRFDDRNNYLQIVITAMCAYGTFFLAEGLFHMSGALAVVVAGWILAWKMWPKVISPSAMKSFWRTIDFLSECMLFVVVGFYMGFEAFDVNFGKCLGYAASIWGLSIVCRFVTLFASWFVFKAVGPALNWRELCLWSWCSLKSRIGLALITEFSLHLLEESSTKELKREVIFIVGAVFVLSNVVNGGLSGYVARLLSLDRTYVVEEQVRSVLFKYSIFNFLKKNPDVQPYLKHTSEFSLSDLSGHHSGDTDTPSSLGIDWETIDLDELVAAFRSVYLSIVRSLYWEEDQYSKISGRAIQDLLVATDQAMEEIENQPLNDFYHLMVILPSRQSKSDHYRVIYILTTFIESHMTARAAFEKELLQPVRDSGAASEAMLGRLNEAWAIVATESVNSEEFAKREVLIRFDHDCMSTFFGLRNLRVKRLHSLLEHYRTRGLLCEKDSEESHEAFVEDMEGIKDAMRKIGEGLEEHGELADEAVLLTASPPDLAIPIKKHQ